MDTDIPAPLKGHRRWHWWVATGSITSLITRTFRAPREASLRFLMPSPCLIYFSLSCVCVVCVRLISLYFSPKGYIRLSYLTFQVQAQYFQFNPSLQVSNFYRTQLDGAMMNMRAYPHVAVNNNGDVLLSYSIFSTLPLLSMIPFFFPAVSRGH